MGLFRIVQRTAKVRQRLESFQIGLAEKFTGELDEFGIGGSYSIGKQIFRHKKSFCKEAFFI